MSANYDLIGAGYSRRRQADPRIAAALVSALGDARTVVNVGAGAGSYEPLDRDVLAVEPSAVMVAQRQPGSAAVVRAVAEALPFRNEAADATMAVLTIHHWSDQLRGLRECRRVARDRVVLLTWDPECEGFWLTRDYFPDLLALDRKIFPSVDVIASCSGRVTVTPVEVPADCVDGFLGAFWRRPEAYLDPAVRSGISSFSRIADIEGPLDMLRQDVESGAWKRRYGELVRRETLDIGYRLIVAQ